MLSPALSAHILIVCFRMFTTLLTTFSIRRFTRFVLKPLREISKPNLDNIQETLEASLESQGNLDVLRQEDL